MTVILIDHHKCLYAQIQGTGSAILSSMHRIILTRFWSVTRQTWMIAKG